VFTREKRAIVGAAKISPNGQLLRRTCWMLKRNVLMRD
jgi:hypothetical protein